MRNESADELQLRGVTKGLKYRAERARFVAFLSHGLGDLRLETRLRDHVDFVLSLCSGNQSLAAELLGLHRRTLQRMLRRMARRSRHHGYDDSKAKHRRGF
jgi:DNA-binding NtrC family response regulator